MGTYCLWISDAGVEPNVGKSEKQSYNISKSSGFEYFFTQKKKRVRFWFLCQNCAIVILIQTKETD